MQLSIILLAQDRVELFRKALASIFNHTSGGKWELLLVLNGASPEVIRVAREWAYYFPQEIRLLEIARVKPGAARNQAVARAKGEILFFVDDDIELLQNPLPVLERIFADPKILVAGGANLTPEASGVFARASGQAFASFFGAAFMSARYRREKQGRFVGEESLILCNLAVRRRLFQEQGFPSQFICGEENAFLLSLPKRLESFWSDPALAVAHYRRESFRSLFFQCFRYGWGRAQGLRYVSPWRRSFFFLPTVAVLVHFYLWAWVFSGMPVSALMALPYAVYGMGLVVASLSSLVRTEDAPASFLQILVTPWIHVAYGIGFGVSMAQQALESLRFGWQRRSV